MSATPGEASRKLIEGALILSAAGFAVKILSAGYRVPFQNIAGDVGFYIYQQVYPLYGIAASLAASGFPAVISKMEAENLQSGQKDGKQETARIAFFLLFLLGLLLFGVLYTGSELLAGFMGDSKLAPLLKMTSFIFLLMPASAALRGFFQGRHLMGPAAGSQITEQFVRVVLILILSYFLVESGKSLYEIGSTAVFSSLAGSGAGILLLFFFLLKREGLDVFRFRRPGLRRILEVAKSLFIQGFAFCLTGIALVLFQLIDSLNVYALLRESGLGELAAKSLKGAYDRGQPLLQLGVVAANAFSLALTPLLAGWLVKGERNELAAGVKLSLRISLAVGTAASAGLICLIKPVNVMLFTDTKGTSALAVFSLAIVLFSLILTKAAVLQTMGKWRTVTAVILAGLVLKYCLNTFFIPVFRITGASLATVVSLALMEAVLYYVLKRELGGRLFEPRDIAVIAGGTGIMAAALVLLNMAIAAAAGAEPVRAAAAIQALSGVAFGACITLIYFLRRGLFSRDELSLLPGGTKLLKFIKQTDKQKQEGPN